MGPFSERHFNDQHGDRDHYVNGVAVMGGQLKSGNPEDVDHDSAHRRCQQQDRKRPIPEIGGLVDLLLFLEAADQNVNRAKDQKGRSDIADPSLGVSKRDRSYRFETISPRRQAERACPGIRKRGTCA